MGVAQGEFEDLAGSGGAVAYADEFHFFAVTLVNAFDHVVDEGAVEAVLSAVLAVVAGTCEYYVAVFNFDGEVGVDGLLELSVRALDGYRIGFFINRHCYARGDCDGGFTYSRHIEIVFSG